VHAPTLLLGLAHAQAGMGKLVEATSTYRRIVNEGVPPHSPLAWAKAFDAARAELVALKPRLPSLLIDVTGAPSPEVTVDGAVVNAGDAVPADPGPRVVKATAEGFAPAQTTAIAREGATTAVSLHLQALPRAPAAEAPPPAPPKTPALRVAGFVTIGVGVAGLGLGGVTGALAIAKHGDLAKQCPGGACTSASTAGEISSYHTVGTLSTIGFIAGGALAATGVVLVLVAPKPKPAGADVSVAIGASGLAVAGRF
ncbi:MAG TPA: hypothetical protein VHB21_20725, partial [Minicystis sp.]|nr:hypothetical protein [Minicystis sp.]